MMENIHIKQAKFAADAQQPNKRHNKEKEHDDGDVGEGRGKGKEWQNDIKSV